MFLLIAASAAGMAIFSYFSNTHHRIINNHYEVRRNGEYALAIQQAAKYSERRTIDYRRLEGLRMDRDALSAAKPFWEKSMGHAVQRNYNLRLKDDWTCVFTSVHLPKIPPLPEADKDLSKWWSENIESFAKENEFDTFFMAGGRKWFLFDVEIVNNEPYETIKKFFDLRDITSE